MLTVTRVDIRVPESVRDARLLGFARIELEGSLVVCNLKLYRRKDGRVGVCMPNCPERLRCDGCNAMVSKVARYCQNCGAKRPLREALVPHHDTVFPTSREQRAAIESAVLHAWVDATTAPHAKAS